MGLMCKTNCIENNLLRTPYTYTHTKYRGDMEYGVIELFANPPLELFTLFYQDSLKPA